MNDLRRDTPFIRHNLAVALQFEDAFTGAIVGAPLEVAIPALSWTAIHGGDDTYRFVEPITGVPAGTYDVAVTAPGGEYTNFVPFQITLPLAGSLPPTRLGWTVSRPLWPTRVVRLRAFETGLVGRLETAGVAQPGRKVRFLGTMAPVDPFTYSDADGEFIARFPYAKRDTTATPPVLALDLAVEIDDGAASATPSSITLDLGTTKFQRFDVT